MVDRKLNDTTYAPYTDFIWALPDNADLRIPHDTTSSCDKVSFVDVFSPCLVSRQYKQSERSTTRTKNRGSLKVWNSIVESWIQIQIFKLDLEYDERTSESSLFFGGSERNKNSMHICIQVDPGGNCGSSFRILFYNNFPIVYNWATRFPNRREHLNTKPAVPKEKSLLRTSL